MRTYFSTAEEVIADENFQAWYLKNHPERIRAWESWLAENPQQQVVVSEATAIMARIFVEEASLPQQQIQHALNKLETAIQTTPVVRMRRRFNWVVSAIAAAAVIAIILTLVVVRNFSRQTVLETTYGKLGEYKLPDGSEVLLNAHSEVTLGKKWHTGTDREIWLKGEAFFKVTHTNKNARFVVHTNNMDIVVTGTQFNAISRDDETSVLLTEGSVTIIGHDGKKFRMNPGDFVRIENNAPAIKLANEEKLLAWKQSKLVFDGTSMKEVAEIITRYYGVRVIFSDSAIADKEIGGIMANDNLDLLIESLEALGEFKIVKTGTEIIISSPN